MAENQKVAAAEQNLKQDSISILDVVIMSVSAAGPAMCLGGSFGTIMQGAGKAVSLAFLLATLVIVMIGLNYGQLSRRYNSAGGTYSYVRGVFGEKVGFVSGWVYMGVNICTGVIGAIFATYLHEMFPAVPQWLGVLILLVPIFFVGWNGVEMTTKALIAVWVVQMALLIYPAIRIMTMRAGEVENILANSAQAFVPSYGVSGLMLGVLVCVWAFVGFECPAYMGEELKGGSRSVKIAVTVSAIAIGLVYVIACWFWTAGMNMADVEAIQNSPTTLNDYAALVGYAMGGKLISIATIVSCIGCFFAFSTSTPRCLYDMGRTGYLPKSLSKVNKHQTPHIALIAYCVVWTAVALFGAYGNTDVLFTMMALFASVSFILICAANIKDRWNEKGAKAVVLNKIVPVVAIAVLMYMVFSSDGVYLLVTALWIVASAIASVVWYNRRKK